MFHQLFKTEWIWLNSSWSIKVQSCDRGSGRRPKWPKRPPTRGALYYTRGSQRQSPIFPVDLLALNIDSGQWVFLYVQIIHRRIHSSLERFKIPSGSRVMIFWKLPFWPVDCVFFLPTLLWYIIWPISSAHNRFKFCMLILQGVPKRGFSENFRILNFLSIFWTCEKKSKNGKIEGNLCPNFFRGVLQEGFSCDLYVFYFVIENLDL